MKAMRLAKIQPRATTKGDRHRRSRRRDRCFNPVHRRSSPVWIRHRRSAKIARPMPSQRPGRSSVRVVISMSASGRDPSPEAASKCPPPCRRRRSRADAARAEADGFGIGPVAGLKDHVSSSAGDRISVVSAHHRPAWTVPAPSASVLATGPAESGVKVVAAVHEDRSGLQPVADGLGSKDGFLCPDRGGQAELAIVHQPDRGLDRRLRRP